MIRVRKPANPPNRSALATRGATETATLCAERDAGAVKFTFDREVYGAASIKSLLLKAQHNKCCYCETKFTHAAHGHVEHFRPKGGWYQQEGEKELNQPGYYWLAYNWSNLYVSCPVCNDTYKRNFFPLANPAERNVWHGKGILHEQPLLLDPGGPDDPELHVGFRGEFVHPIDDSSKGTASIRYYGLNRPALEEDRREKLNQMKLILVIAESPEMAEEDRADARTMLDHAVSDKGEYASMMRWLLRNFS